jgi:hypothetical protein
MVVDKYFVELTGGEAKLLIVDFRQTHGRGQHRIFCAPNMSTLGKELVHFFPKLVQEIHI